MWDPAEYLRSDYYRSQQALLMLVLSLLALFFLLASIGFSSVWTGIVVGLGLSAVALAAIYGYETSTQPFVKTLQELDALLIKNSVFFKRLLFPGVDISTLPDGIFMIARVTDEQFCDACRKFLDFNTFLLVCKQRDCPDDKSGIDELDDRFRSIINLCEKLQVHEGVWNPYFDRANMKYVKDHPQEVPQASVPAETVPLATV
ncbi:MAG: hypothetical protein AAB511_00965 [Patescibacteria group bacterium]